MKKAYKIIRAILVTTVLLAVIVPATLYVVLSLPGVQNAIRTRTENLLSEKLGADVTVGDLGIMPFNRAILRDVSVVSSGDTLLTVDRLGAGINLYELLMKRRVTVNYAEIRGFDGRLTRESPDAPLNIQPIIDALSNPNSSNPPAQFDLRINTVVIRGSKVSYDVMSEPQLDCRFDKNHISVSDFRADVNIPHLKNDGFTIDLKRLDFKERSGIEVNNLSGRFHVAADEISWSGVRLAMPGSELTLGDMSLPIDGFASIGRVLDESGATVTVERGSHVYLPDLAPFVPDLAELNNTVDVAVSAGIKGDCIELPLLSASMRGGEFSVEIKDGVLTSYTIPDSARLSIPDLSIGLHTSLFDRMSNLKILPTVRRRIPGAVEIKGSGIFTFFNGELAAKIVVDGGTADLKTTYTRQMVSDPFTVAATLVTEHLDLGKVMDNADFGELNADISGEFVIGNYVHKGEAAATVNDFTFRRHTYDNLTANATIDGDYITVGMRLSDDSANILADGGGRLKSGAEEIYATVRIDKLDLYAMNIIDGYSGYLLSGTVTAGMSGLRPDRSNASLTVDDLEFSGPDGRRLTVDSIEIVSTSASIPRQMKISSGLLNGSIEGEYTFEALPDVFSSIMARAFPVMFPDGRPDEEKISGDPGNCFSIGFTLNETEALREFFDLPISAIYPVSIDGYVDSSRDYARLTVDAPYLRQRNKLVENTNLSVEFDGESAENKVYLASRFPVKQGMMDLVFNSTAKDNTVDSDLKWSIDRDRLYEGNISLTTKLVRDDDGVFGADVDIHNSQMTFNDSVWIVAPAGIKVRSEGIDVAGFKISREGQYVTIDGRASASPEDSLIVDVMDLNLDYIFESVGIDNVQLGGDATGMITATSVLSGVPRIHTDGIEVSDISYNKCVLGDATVLSHWDMDAKAVVIDGTIHQDNGGTSKVEGEIYALSDSIDIRLTADMVNMGFMEYYMSAFASDISGIGTGTARVYGSFHDIDMEGDIYVENLRLKLNFTNTYFTATDSLHITPGEIRLTDITLHDPYGHTAMLNGVLHHDFFRDPTFEFDITEAKELLVYDESPKQNPDWYGKIFVNGGAIVTGRPGVVKIAVNVSTAAGSVFTFVLSDMEVADEYTFLTFRDKNRLLTEVAGSDEDVNMGLVNRLREMLARQQEDSSSDYIIELLVDITPQAEIDLLMDPVAGDRIRSNGNGNMRMVYDSAENDLQIFGKYTLSKGFYNFTLQDIIIKDFIIREGSSISFTGDPLHARLDINAVYALNANLSDLDESFLQDKDLNRTNVPVHAVLKVNGDIQQPEISFDLEFPTLTSDIDRKVRSIISTEEMMNRQIIYLLALNRFYTPDYMASTTKGNELFSVASSTLSSQLSNMLGQLSDNWAIAPNLRSDRGDFSDVEVDVALSSRLLNNRLLLNGNFGYRDKSLNSNQFIGDFDLEYLLNRAGTIRLKAYNRYNDQNYYLRTATTTQGVGVVFKRDFDSFLSFLRRMRRNQGNQSISGQRNDSPADTVQIPATVVLPDTIEVQN